MLKLAMRTVCIKPQVNMFTSGSCLVQAGHTHVLCTSSYTERRPHFLHNTNSGWISAEYSMLPHATHERSSRESAHKPRGRSMEIQRLIARSLRSVCALDHLQGFHILLDCDVLQADGSTRTNSINGAFVALALTVRRMMEKRLIDQNPIMHNLCAISCAIHDDGSWNFDPCYKQDSEASADFNLVLTHNGSLVEIQGTGEKNPLHKFPMDRFLQEAFESTKSVRDEQMRALAY